MTEHGLEPNAGTDSEEPVPAEDRVEELERERDEYLDSLQRLKAEFDNFRKRSAREYEALSARATESLVKELLPILDDLERALAAAEDYVDVHVALGRVEAGAGRRAEARRHFERAIELEPSRRAELAVWLERVAANR